MTPPTMQNPPNAAFGWLREAADDIRQAVLRYGAVLIHDVPVREPRDLVAAREALSVTPHRATESFGRRALFGHGVTSLIEWPAGRELCPYQEETFSRSFPRTVLTACVQAPDGGEACLADSRELAAHLPPELISRFAELGWALTRVFREDFGMTWQDAFGVTSRDRLWELLPDIGIDHTVLSDGGLRTVRRRPATVVHPVTGEECWFNQAAFFNSASLEPRDLRVLRRAFGPDIPMETSYGDGSPLTDDDVTVIYDAYAKTSSTVAWRAGDLLVTDNILTAQGRQPWTGSPTFLTTMGDPVATFDAHPGASAGDKRDQSFR